jgi:hypothetical protein
MLRREVSIDPPGGMADDTRRAGQARRHKLLDALVACVLLLATAGTVYLISGRYNSKPAPWPPGPRTIAKVNYAVSLEAISGQYLYLASTKKSVVAVYDLRTGKLVRRVTVPTSPTWLTVGPGGLVWSAGTGYQPGLMLLSKGLTKRSRDAAQAGPVIPAGPQTVETPTQYGLLDVRVPAPGEPGRATARLEPGTSLGPSQNTAPGNWAGLLDGRVAVEVTDAYGYNSHLVIAGEPGRTFGGDGQQVGAVTSTGKSLWAQLLTGTNSAAATSGPLVRLDGQLQVTTPKFIQGSAVLATTKDVWSTGETIWAATGALDHALVCFSAVSDSGPVVTVAAGGVVTAVVGTRATAYVATAVHPGTGRPSVITSYPVPAACQ